MVLSIVLCGIILLDYLLISIFIWTKTTMPIYVNALNITIILYVIILSFASTLMNVSFAKKKRFFRRKSIAGAWIGGAALLFCILLLVFLILIKQRWIVFDYKFITDNHSPNPFSLIENLIFYSTVQ